MAQLERNKDDDHYFIRVGPSKGTWQITEEGVSWLCRRDRQLPAPGEKVSLDDGDYRYLRDKGYLYIRGEMYEKRETFAFSVPTPEVARYGPSLLLCLDNRHDFLENVAEPWMLFLKLDELDENGQKALLSHQDAVAIGSWPSVQSMVDLRWIQDARRWPEVTPKAGTYELYWQNNQQRFFRLNEATPTLGLRDDWQGSVFRKFEHPQLTNTWRYCRPDESISLNACQELYWLARMNYHPEWPDQEQRVGVPIKGWQLWHLHITVGNTLWETVERWLSYRHVNLFYPSWRVHLLNPLSFFTAPRYICAPGQQLLVRCDPPTRPVEHGQTHVFLSFAPVHNAPSSKPVPGQAQSNALSLNQITYLHSPALSLGQEYQIRVRGEANGQAFSLQAAPLSARQPAWLQGLGCTLMTLSKRYTFEAFSAEQQPSLHTRQLQIPRDFSREELANLTWDWQPVGVPCSWRWEYLSPQGKHCQEKRESISTGSALTTWWQTYIWPAVAESPWVKLTLDAASFGDINLILVIQPEPSPKQEPQTDTDFLASQEGVLVSVVNQAWWTNTRFTTSILWLSRVAEQEMAQEWRVVPPTLSKTLEQLCVPDMPTALKSALMLLATRRSMPIWIYFRLQVLLADLRSASELIVEERR